MSEFLNGLGFGIARGFFNNMLGLSRFGGFWGNPLGCCCMPSFFSIPSLYMVPRLNFNNIYPYPTIMPQVSFPKTYNTISPFNFSAPKIETFSEFHIPQPVINTSSYADLVIGDTFIKSKDASKTTGQGTKAKHWSNMTDVEMRTIYGNYDRNITTTHNVNVDKLNNYLKDKGVLKDKGQAFIDAQNKYGISASVLVAICMNESAKGTSNLAKTKNNVGGVRVSGSKEFRSYEKVEDCINDIAELLKNHYVTNSGVSGKSLTKLYEINAKYCPVAEVTENSRWAANVEKYASEIESALV